MWPYLILEAGGALTTPHSVSINNNSIPWSLMLFAFLVSVDPGDMFCKLAMVVLIRLLEEWASPEEAVTKSLLDFLVLKGRFMAGIRSALTMINLRAPETLFHSYQPYGGI